PRVEPAPQRPQATPSSSRVKPDAKHIISDTRLVLFLGLELVVLAIYSLIVSISYFRALGNDQSAVLNGEFAPEIIANSGGPFGAWLSNLMIHDWLGVGAFIIIIYIGTCGLMMLNVFKTDFWKLTMRCLLCATAVSIIGGFATVNLASPIYWGGMHGHLLNERLILISGFWGALAVSVVMAGLVGLLFYKQLRSFFGIMGQGLQAFRARQQRRKAQSQAREEEYERMRSEEAARQAELTALEDQRRRAEHEAALAKANAEAEAANLERLRLEAESRAIAAQQAASVAQVSSTVEQKTSEMTSAPAFNPGNGNNEEAPVPSSELTVNSEEQEPHSPEISENRPVDIPAEHAAYIPQTPVETPEPKTYKPLFQDAPEEPEEKIIPRPSVSAETAISRPLFRNESP
ncbi:MAG: DNA translocase FtsK 4TM domain-containing protein, partial [Duncaniella sp.]|nr:DNA translocase FtsK 4TM domain-containing protein [Duncaniella sp.]